DIGYDTYHKILDEAIQELKETEFKDIFPPDDKSHFVNDCQIDTDLEILIPSDYISNITERLNIYKEIDDLEREDQLTDYLKNLRDRFGPVPAEVNELMSAIQLRWKAKALGFEKILLKGGILKGYFVSNPESSFYRSHVFTDLISYIQANPNRIKLSEKNNKLAISFSGIKSVAQANLMFDDLKKHVTPEPVISNH
ncbi:MAG TPA: transcription-repair coupling factor, partial [Bacteroidia bacterium]|nr:transcription-repair coupling factor [Bacteroidia bacterium]